MKCILLQLECNSPMQKCRPETDWLDSSSAQKDMDILVNKVNMSQ